MSLPGGLHFDARDSNIDHMAHWIQVGRVALKVVQGHLDDGTAYLNLFLRNLGKTGLPVGGLLGEDSHDEEATPSAGCNKLLDLGMTSEWFNDAADDEDDDPTKRSASFAKALLD